MGTKKWYLRKADIAFPFRACATHFKDEASASILRTQHAIAHLDASSDGKQFNMVPEDIEETCETVVLQPGDVMYHPAGIWHKVETLPADHNSLSINFSLFPLQWGEMMQECMQTMMLRMTHWRRPVMVPRHNCPENAPAKQKKAAEEQSRTFTRKMAEAMVESLKNELAHVTATHMLPNCVLDSSMKTLPKTVQFDEEGNIVGVQTGSKMKKDEKSVKKFTSLFPKLAMLKTSEDAAVDEENDDEEEENETIILKRNPMGVIVEVNEELLELMGDGKKAGGSSDDDDEDDEEEEEEEEEDEDEEDSSSMTTFDLWSNFVADETNYGSPAVKMTLRVPTKPLRKVLVNIANTRAEVPLKKKVFASTAGGDILPFLCYVGFFAIA